MQEQNIGTRYRNETQSLKQSAEQSVITFGDHIISIIIIIIIKKENSSECPKKERKKLRPPKKYKKMYEKI